MRQNGGIEKKALKTALRSKGLPESLQFQEFS